MSDEQCELPTGESGTYDTWWATGPRARVCYDIHLDPVYTAITYIRHDEGGRAVGLVGRGHVHDADGRMIWLVAEQSEGQ